MINSRISFGLLLIFLVVVCDQASKLWIVDVIMRPPQSIVITEFFNLVIGYNRGVSFGMLDMQSPSGRWILSGISSTITLVLFIWMWRTEKKLIAGGLGLIIGGAIGNVIDRLTIGAVVDFLDFHWAGYHWPAFNVADIAITCGAAVIICESFINPQKKYS